MAWIPAGNQSYLYVVDTNASDPKVTNPPTPNGWRYTGTPMPVNFATGVGEPTGIDYDPDGNTLFVSQDDGRIFVFTNFNTVSEQMINMSVLGSDTEDPAYNPDNGRLYWVDGEANSLFERDPVDGVWNNGNDITVSWLLDSLAGGDTDWEGLAWDPGTRNLLIANTLTRAIYEVGFHNGEIAESGGVIFSHNTINASGVHTSLTRINGMGIAPASYNPDKWSLWVTDRNTSSMFELSYDGTTPPPPPPPPSTTTPTGPTTTQGPITTTTTTTTIPGQTTTTTIGSTTTTNPQSPPPEPDPDLVFSDMAGSVFAKSIEWLAAEGITQGCNPPANTMFCPDGRVTRGQMAAFLVRAKGLPAYNGPDRFRDDDRSVFEGAIERLAQAGITVGCNPPLNDRFCPDRNVTRGEMAAFLGRAFGYTDNGGGDWFVDDDDSVFENSIDRLRTAGITQGCNPPRNDRYCPDQFVTRGQMAAFLKRALDG